MHTGWTWTCIKQLIKCTSTDADTDTRSWNDLQFICLFKQTVVPTLKVWSVCCALQCLIMNIPHTDSNTFVTIYLNNLVRMVSDYYSYLFLHLMERFLFWYICIKESLTCSHSLCFSAYHLKSPNMRHCMSVCRNKTLPRCWTFYSLLFLTGIQEHDDNESKLLHLFQNYSLIID